MGDPSNRKPRGVMWDAKAKVWRARIMVEGVRTYLGGFATAEEAGEAYARVKGPRGGRNQTKGEAGRERPSHKAAILEASKGWRGSYNGRPEPQIWEVEGEEHRDTFALWRSEDLPLQVYGFGGRTFRRFRGKMWALWEWRARCAACWEPFTVLTPASVENMGVPSAYCPAHRRPGRPRKAPRVLPQPEGGERASGGDPGGAAEGSEAEVMEAARLAGIADLV